MTLIRSATDNKAKAAEPRRAPGDDAIRSEAAADLRSRIDRIALTPGEDGSLAAERHGDVAGVLAPRDRLESERPGKAAPGRRATVVAGARCQPFRTPVSAFIAPAT